MEVGNSGGRATQGPQLDLAVLIDADNASPDVVTGLLAEVAKLGTVSVKRIYGDWTTPRLGSWKVALLDHSIQPVQQFGYTMGKNATDSAMIIDAMDLLYTGRFGGFCLVSSDSDFTRLAVRIREDGRLVFGFGEEKTPRAFVAACNRFIYTEVFRLRPEAGEHGPTCQRSPNQLRGDSALLSLLRSAVEACSDEDGWAHLGPIGSYLVKSDSAFDSRNYGYAKLSELISVIGLFDLDRRNGHVYVRDPRRKTAA